MFEVMFGFALVLLGFAAVHDWKTTFVSDWVVYALFCLGLLGLVVGGELVAGLLVTGGLGLLALTFYYGGVFAQGDARLLIALGPVLPGIALASRGWYAIGFVFLLLVIGLVYTLVISGWKAGHDRGYYREVHALFTTFRFVVWGLLGGGFICSFLLSGMWWGLVFGGGWIVFGLWIHAKAVEKTCFIARVAPRNLLEGDWLVSSVKVGRHVLHPSVAGLSRPDIALLRRYNRSVLIKQGIPFVPVFFSTYLLMGFVALGGYEQALLGLVQEVLS